MARRHLAIFLRGGAKKILTGEKKVDIRLSEFRIPPYLAVQKEDEILLKDAGGKIIGEVTVDNCLYYDSLNPDNIEQIKNNYNQQAINDEKFWRSKQNAKFASVIFFKNPHNFLTPVAFKKSDRRAWIVLKE